MRKCNQKEICKFIRQVHIDLLNNTKKQDNMCFIGEIWEGNINNYAFKLSEIFDGSYIDKIDFKANRNYYYSTSTFKPSQNGGAYRRINNIDTCQNIVIDVDCHKGYSYEKIKEYINLLLTKINQAKMKFMPSYAVATGRGVQLGWQLKTVSCNKTNLKKLKNLTKALISELNGFIDDIVQENGFKADEYLEIDTKASCNFAGYFRLVGTVNAKCDVLVKCNVRGGMYTIKEMCKYYNITRESIDNQEFDREERGISLTQANKVKNNNTKKSCSINTRKASNKNNISPNYINRVVDMAINDGVDTEKLFKEIANTATKVNITKGQKLSIKENQLMKKRINMICYLLDEYKAQGISEGYRDILLFLLYNCKYFLDTNSALNDIWEQNSRLLVPLNDKEIEIIIDYIDSKGGLRFKDETFISWLNLTDEQIEMYYHHKITRYQGHLNMLKKEERNKLIREDYAQIMARNPKPTVLSAKQELHEKYGLSIRHIQNIISPKVKEMVKQSVEKVKKVLTNTSKQKNIVDTNSATSTQGKNLGNVCAVYGGEKCVGDVVSNEWEEILRQYREDGYEEYFNSLDEYCVYEQATNEARNIDLNNDNDCTENMMLSEQLGRLESDLKNCYPNMYRFLNRKDWYVLKSMYLYAEYKFKDSYAFGVQSMSLSYAAIRYLGLPLRQDNGHFDDYMLEAKKFVRENIKMSSIFSMYAEYDKTFGYVRNKDVYSRSETKMLKLSIRKLMYLGLIRGCTPKQCNGYSISSYVLTQFDFDYAERKASNWFTRGLHTSYIMSDVYVYAHLDKDDLDRMCPYVRGEYVNRYDIDDVGREVDKLLFERCWIKFNELKKWQQEVFEKYCSCAWFGEKYRVVKVRGKNADNVFDNLIRRIVGYDVHSGTKVIIPKKLLDGWDDVFYVG